MHQMPVDPNAPKSRIVLSRRIVVLLAMRTVSRLRCQSLMTFAGAADSGAVSAMVLVTDARNALPHLVGVQVEPGLEIG